MKILNQNIQQKFDEMSKSGKLFRSTMTGEEIWNLYINSFENDPIFRDPESSYHNCNLCKNFIRRYGNVISINEDYTISTFFDTPVDDEYNEVFKILSNKIKSSGVSDVFFETFNSLNSLPYEKCNANSKNFKLGLSENVKQYPYEEAMKFGVVSPDEIKVFNHFSLSLNSKFVDNTGASVESIMGKYRDAKNVFQKAMEKISIDTLYLVRDLINQESLLDGKAHLYKVEALIVEKTKYNNIISAFRQNNYCWFQSYGFSLARFANELIGVLCIELSEGKELNDACMSWNKRVDPANYMKATAPITNKQIEEAKKFVEENGYSESFDRRFATIDDIKVDEILHSNVGSNGPKSVSIFDGVKATSTQHKRSEFKGVGKVAIDFFMKNILPTCTSVEVFLQNNHDGNMVSLTTSEVEESKRIFKWNNNYSWTFNGNLAGKSQIKNEVKEKGGVVDAPFRFSLMWNDGNVKDGSDLDAWCRQPDGTLIGFNTNYRKDRGNQFTTYSGQLDLDVIYPNGIAVENIYFKDVSKLRNGKYELWVNPYSVSNSQGFKAEIEINGEIFNYEYNKKTLTNRTIKVANVIFENGQFNIEHLLEENNTSKNIYGLETNKFHRVNLICLSPNHWGENNIGNKHYLFMIDGCKSPFPIRGFHVENLLPELLQHRKVLEVLGATTLIESTDKQLSGLGFNATVRDELLVKLEGTHKRVVKIKF